MREPAIRQVTMHQLISTEIPLPEPGALRRFVQQEVEHWQRQLYTSFGQAKHPQTANQCFL